MFGETTYELRLNAKAEERFYGHDLNASHLLGYISLIVVVRENRRMRLVTGTPDSKGVVMTINGESLQPETVRALEDCLIVKKVEQKYEPKRTSRKAR